jgi:hypothetical protein
VQQPSTSMTFSEANRESSGKYQPERDSITSCREKAKSLYTDSVQDTADSWGNLGLHPTAVCECGLSDQTPEHILQTFPIMHVMTSRQHFRPDLTTLKTKLWGSAHGERRILLPMTISEEESNLFCAFHLLNRGPVSPPDGTSWSWSRAETIMLVYDPCV